MQRKLFFFSLMFFTGLLVNSCKDDEAPADPNVVFTATLNGASQATPNPSTATGSATLTFNLDTKIFTIVVTYTGMTATAAHIHKGAAGASGPVVFPFASATSPINFTSEALTSEEEADLNAGLNYVNVHSDDYPGGEIRGQLLK